MGEMEAENEEWGEMGITDFALRGRRSSFRGGV